jgi:AcrR family transcriptional regulator
VGGAGAGRPTQTTPAAWVAAALDEIEEAGVDGLAVVAVARRLGVSKGGCYHHFADRRELLRAALALWEQRFVAELNKTFEAIENPGDRLHSQLRHALIELEPTVIVRLMAEAEDPDVGAALARATTARLALLTRIFTELGFTNAIARHRALSTYSAYLGFAQLRREDPAVLGTPAMMRAYLAELEAMLRSAGPGRPGGQREARSGRARSERSRRRRRS